MSDNDKKQEKGKKEKKNEKKQPQPPKIGRIFEKPGDPEIPDHD